MLRTTWTLDDEGRLTVTYHPLTPAKPQPRTRGLSASGDGGAAPRSGRIRAWAAFFRASRPRRTDQDPAVD